jgi:RNA polymerase sigma-70 factor, ECF subfamily
MAGLPRGFVRCSDEPGVPSHAVVPVTAGGFESTLRAAQAGAEWAVAALYRQHDPRLLRYLRAQEPQDFADIASDTWLDVARNLHTFTGGEDAFRGWLFTIMRRRLVDHRRARGRRPVELAPPGELQGPTAASAEDAALTGSLGEAEALRLVARLAPEQAEVLLLRVLADLDVETVAGIVGRRPGTVRVLQHRALKKLAKELDGTCNARGEDSDGTQRDAQAPAPPR